MPIKILAFAGSTRTQSYNKILVKNAAQMAEQQGADVTCIDLRDYPLPLYDGDLEEQDGIPENALKVRNLLRKNHGILISCPEYNSAISAVLKNMIDWVSRPIPGDPPLVAFSGKTAALLAATPGSLAGIRTLVSVRTILGNIGMIVIPKQFGLGNAAQAFDENGLLLDETARNQVSGVVRQLVTITAGIHQSSS